MTNISEPIGTVLHTFYYTKYLYTNVREFVSFAHKYNRRIHTHKSIKFAFDSNRGKIEAW